MNETLRKIISGATFIACGVIATASFHEANPRNGDNEAVWDEVIWDNSELTTYEDETEVIHIAEYASRSDMVLPTGYWHKYYWDHWTEN